MLFSMCYEQCIDTEGKQMVLGHNSKLNKSKNQTADDAYNIKMHNTKQCLSNTYVTFSDSLLHCGTIP